MNSSSLRIAAQRALDRLRDLPRYLRANTAPVLGSIVEEVLADLKTALEPVHWSTPLEQAMVAAGYQRCANEKYGWTPAGSGVPEPWSATARLGTEVGRDRIRVFRRVFFGEPYTRRTWEDTVTLAVFEDVPSYLDWCRKNGRLSEPGLPPFAQGLAD